MRTGGKNMTAEFGIDSSYAHGDTIENVLLHNQQRNDQLGEFGQGPALPKFRHAANFPLFLQRACRVDTTAVGRFCRPYAACVLRY